MTIRRFAQHLNPPLVHRLFARHRRRWGNGRRAGINPAGHRRRRGSGRCAMECPTILPKVAFPALRAAWGRCGLFIQPEQQTLGPARQGGDVRWPALSTSHVGPGPARRPRPAAAAVVNARAGWILPSSSAVKLGADLAHFGRCRSPPRRPWMSGVATTCAFAAPANGRQHRQGEAEPRGDLGRVASRCGLSASDPLKVDVQTAHRARSRAMGRRPDINPPRPPPPPAGSYTGPDRPGPRPDRRAHAAGQAHRPGLRTGRPAAKAARPVRLSAAGGGPFGPREGCAAGPSLQAEVRVIHLLGQDAGRFHVRATEIADPGRSGQAGKPRSPSVPLVCGQGS